MQTNNNNKSERPYAAYGTGKLTLMQTMGILAALGIVLTWILQHFFVS